MRILEVRRWGGLAGCEVVGLKGFKIWVCVILALTLKIGEPSQSAPCKMGLGLFWEIGKENGNYYNGIAFRGVIEGL